MKKTFFICIVFSILALTFAISMNKSYSLGIKLEVTGEKGSRVLNYYDYLTGYKFSIDTLVEYYDYSEYMAVTTGNEEVYFYRGNEIDKNTYTRGLASETADRKALEYGSNGRRVKTTEDVINNLKDIFNNQRYGEFMFTFSPYDNIDWNSVKNYWTNAYGVSYPRKNYYTYSQKGNQEVDRWGLDISQVSSGELKINAINIRITKDELEVTDNFANKLISEVKNKSDYDKIAFVYKYITTKTNYYVDDGYDNTLASTASAYDALIQRESACVGFSIAFSYLMDKLNIESYIVDNISELDVSNRYIKSVHTWNVVKLDNKFYKIDTTGRIFLGALNQNELSDNLLNISTAKYTRSDLPNINFSIIDNYLNEAKSIKTTTTQTPILFPTKKATKEFIIPNSQTKTIKTTNTTNTKENTTITSIKYENGTTQVFVVTIPTTKNKENENSRVEQQNKKVNLNFILIPILIIVIILYIVYKILLKKKKGDISGQQSM